MTDVGIVTASSASNPGNSKSATASCDAGEVVVGGGVTVEASSQLGGLVVTGSYPSSTSEWTASATEDEMDNATTWSVTAYAICAGSGA
jgi:hypothetical protein